MYEWCVVWLVEEVLCVNVSVFLGCWSVMLYKWVCLGWNGCWRMCWCWCCFWVSVSFRLFWVLVDIVWCCWVCWVVVVFCFCLFLGVFLWSFWWLVFVLCLCSGCLYWDWWIRFGCLLGCVDIWDVLSCWWMYVWFWVCLLCCVCWFWLICWFLVFLVVVVWVWLCWRSFWYVVCWDGFGCYNWLVLVWWLVLLWKVVGNGKLLEGLCVEKICGKDICVMLKVWDGLCGLFWI